MVFIMKNKLFTILLLLSLLLFFTSCELIAQEIAGEKAAGAEKLLEGSCVTIKDLDDNIITTIPMTIEHEHMNSFSYFIIDESELLIDDYKIDLDIELQDGFLRKKKGYVNSFYIDYLSYHYNNYPSKKIDDRIKSVREDGKSKLHLEYMNEDKFDLTDVYGMLYYKDSRKDNYEFASAFTICIYKE